MISLCISLLYLRSHFVSKIIRINKILKGEIRKLMRGRRVGEGGYDGEESYGGESFFWEEEAF